MKQKQTNKKSISKLIDLKSIILCWLIALKFLFKQGDAIFFKLKPYDTQIKRRKNIRKNSIFFKAQ